VRVTLPIHKTLEFLTGMVANVSFMARDLGGILDGSATR
jgi:hypothetical protein